MNDDIFEYAFAGPSCSIAYNTVYPLGDSIGFGSTYR